MSQPKIHSQTQILEELIPSILHFNKLGTLSYIPLGPCWMKLSCHLKLADHRWSTVPDYDAIAVTRTHTHTYMHTHTQSTSSSHFVHKKWNLNSNKIKNKCIYWVLLCQLNHLWQNSNIQIKIKPECANMSKWYKWKKQKTKKTEGETMIIWFTYKTVYISTVKCSGTHEAVLAKEFHYSVIHCM